MVVLDEVTIIPEDANWEELAMQAVRSRREFAGLNSDEVRDLTARAIQSRPELVNLDELGEIILVPGRRHPRRSAASRPRSTADLPTWASRGSAANRWARPTF